MFSLSISPHSSSVCVLSIAVSSPLPSSSGVSLFQFLLLIPPSYTYLKLIVSFKTIMQGGASIAVRMSGSQLRKSKFKSSCCRFEALAVLFIPHCFSSLSCINEYLATEREGHLNEVFAHNCSMAECFPEKSKCRWNEQVCQGVKCKVL